MMLDTARTDSPATTEGLPAVRRRQPRLALVAAGLAVLAFILIYVTFQQASQRALVWSVAVDVTRGQPVTADQIQAVEIAADVGAGLLRTGRVSRAELAAGRTWAADLPAGHLVTRALLRDGPELDDGQALVGVDLPPGGWPSPMLGAGATVAVLRTVPNRPAAVLVEHATVDSVTPLGDAPSAHRLVSLVVPGKDAAPVAAAAAAGHVTLVAVP